MHFSEDQGSVSRVEVIAGVATEQSPGPLFPRYSASFQLRKVVAQGTWEREIIEGQVFPGEGSLYRNLFLRQHSLKVFMPLRSRQQGLGMVSFLTYGFS
jgi:hypothetical protein